MLQNIREQIKGWVAAVFLVILAATFLMFGVEYYVQDRAASHAVVATVNGQKIDERQLSVTTRQLQQQQQNAHPNTPLSQDEIKQIKQYALQSLVTNAALIQAAHNSGMQVSLDQVKALIMLTPQFQVNGKFSQVRLEQIIYANGLQPGQFFSQMQNSIMLNQVRSGIEDSGFYLPNEVSALNNLVNQKRSFGYFLIPVSQFKNKITITDKQIADYYQQNTAQFKTPEKVKLSYILLSPEALAKNVVVSDEEVKQYYQSNQMSFTTPKQWQVNRVVIAVPANASASDVASAQQKAEKVSQQLKQGEAIAEKSQTTSISEGQLSGPLAGIVTKLQQNDVSKPFRTAEGFNVIKVLKIEPQIIKTFDQVKDNIKQALIHQKVQQILTDKSEQLSNLTYTNPNSLDEASKSVGVAVATSNWLTRDGDKEGLFKNPALMQAAFSDEVLKQGNNSTPIELKNGGLIVLRVAEHEPSKVQSLAEVQTNIRNLLLDQQALRQAGLVAYQVSTDLKNGKAINEIATQNNLVWHAKEAVGRDDKAVAPEILQSAFQLPVIEKAKSVTTTLLKDENYAVIEVQKIIPPSTAPAPEMQKMLAQSIVNLNGQIMYSLYVKSIMSTAKIVITDSK